MTKVVLGSSNLQRGVIFALDFRLTNTTVKEPVSYGASTEESSWTDVGEELLKRVNGLPGVEYVMYRPFSFHVEIGMAFDVKDVINGVLEMIRSVAAETADPMVDGDIDLHYVRRGGITCPLRDADFDNALREMQLA